MNYTIYKLINKFLKGISSQDIKHQFNIISSLGYKYKFKKEKILPCVIFSLDGTLFNNGLVDRLRGLVNSYAYAKANNIDFRIEHKVPFHLEEFIQPNKYNWTLKPSEKSYNLRYASPISMLDNPNEDGKRLLSLSKSRQYHFYTNTGRIISLMNKERGKSYSISELYNELFIPTEKLQTQIDIHKKVLGDNYISISFRFMQLLGDLIDIHGETLCEEKQIQLIKLCKEQIIKLKQREPEVEKILVTSDSQKFIDKVADIPYVYIIPGEIGHIGHMGGNIFLKTFLDLYMISYAKKVYLCVGEGMYKSNYARFAAQTQNKPFEIIEC